MRHRHRPADSVGAPVRTPTGRYRRLAGAAGLGLAAALTWTGSAAAAAPAALGRSAAAGPVSISYTAAAAAPIMQITEDEPTAQFHPEGEGDYGYTLVTANPSAATALAAVAWPGAAAGNAGTLVAVLGGPTVNALNDPVQASAATGTSTTSSSVGGAPGTEMSASVRPTAPGDQHATATSMLAGGGLGAAGSVGSSSSTATIDFASASSTLTVTAHSSASDIGIDGVVSVGSVTSSAAAVSVGGAPPQLSGATDFHDMTVAGQSAYVDGSGVHLGAPGAPAGPAEVAAVDAALQQAGMEIYFTQPHTITVGGTAYYYAASVLVYWAPPDDPSDNSLTMTLGGSGVSLTDAATPGFATSATGPAVTATPAPSPASPSPSPAAGTPAVGGAAAVGTVGADGGTDAPVAGPPAGSTSLSLPASPSAAAPNATVEAEPAGLRLPGGVSPGWLVLAVAIGLAGGGLGMRVPALLERRAASVCPRQKHPGASERGRP